MANETLREKMVARQIASRGMDDVRLLDAMREVPRDAFVPPHLAEFAYADMPLPIGEGQTISQPFVVALMLAAARIASGDRLLEIGAGSGYAAAVASRLAGEVHAVERHPALADAARQRLAALGYGNIVVRAGDGTLGWPEAAPFDAIIVSAGGPAVPLPLRQQLKVGGRLVMPLGAPDAQRLMRMTRLGAAAFREEDLGPVRFVPLIGAHGWHGETEPGGGGPGCPPCAQPSAASDAASSS